MGGKGRGKSLHDFQKIGLAMGRSSQEYGFWRNSHGVVDLEDSEWMDDLAINLIIDLFMDPIIRFDSTSLRANFESCSDCELLGATLPLTKQYGL